MKTVITYGGANARPDIARLDKTVPDQTEVDNSFWPTVLTVELLVQCCVRPSVCLSVVCDVMYCG